MAVMGSELHPRVVFYGEKIARSASILKPAPVSSRRRTGFLASLEGWP